jgi:hypothetical protein
MKLIVLTLFCIAFLSGFSQKDREKILTSFDYIAYYPDSTIQEARKFSGINLEGTTVEFDKLGKPVAIGHYKKGLKTGRWIYSDGTSDFFEEKKDLMNSNVLFQPYYTPEKRHTGSIVPGCGTGKYQAMQEFYQTYDTLIHSEDKIPFSCWGPQHELIR